MRFAKYIGLAIILAVFIPVTQSMSRWSEDRGVFDDLCYLRQAHLFERFGFGGLDTDARLDDDGYYRAKAKAIGLSGDDFVCHQFMPATQKMVMQYPPGVGAALALFPAGAQVKSLFIATTAFVALIFAISILLAPTIEAVCTATLFGALSIYMMINPTKSSYSIAPTTTLCIMAGFMTVLAFTETKTNRRLIKIAILGLLLGLAVNMRIPNILLAAGYLAILGFTFLRRPRPGTLLEGLAFAIPFVMGLLPTLIANHINAGSPISTTYGPGDTQAHDFSPWPMLKQAWDYMIMTQGQLIVAAAIFTGLLYLKAPTAAYQKIATLTGINMLVTLVFFCGHTLKTPYYLMPIALLSLWTLFFSYLTITLDRRKASSKLSGDQTLSLGSGRI